MGYYASGNGQVILKDGMKVPAEIIAELGREFSEVADAPDGGLWLTFEYNRYHDDDMTEGLQKLAPFVKSGNVEFIGDDDNRWRFHFWNGNMRYQEGRTVYEDANKDWRHSERMELFGTMVDIVEDWLESKGITADDIPCEDRDQAIADGEAPEDCAIIYGEDYDHLTGEFEELLINCGLIEKEE